MKPRMLWGCHSVLAISSCSVAPPGRFSSSSTAAVLLPLRAAGFSDFLALLIAPLAGMAFFPDLLFTGATLARRAPARAFFVAFGFSAVPWLFSVASAFAVIMFRPL